LSEHNRRSKRVPGHTLEI